MHVGCIVRTDGLKEGGIPYHGAKHVQGEATFLIAVGIEQRHQVGLRRIDHRAFRGGLRFDYPRPHGLHRRPHGRVAVRVLGPQGGEVGGKALAQPQVGPFALGHGVAEPLMRGLVGDQIRAYAAAPERPIAVEDGGGVLHAAEARGTLHVRQLLVRIGTDSATEKGDHRGGVGKRAGDVIAQLRTHVHGLRHAPGLLGQSTGRLS